MDDNDVRDVPSVLSAIIEDTERMGFSLSSERNTGRMLRALAASKPGGRLLELGTGTGVGAAWLLSGMDAASTLTSVENDPDVLRVARRHLAGDSRAAFVLADGAAFLESCASGPFDLIYADTWAGKFTHLDLALSFVRVGGIYFVDDLLPQPSWPAGHAQNVECLSRELARRSDFVSVGLAWSSGLLMLVRIDAG